MDEYKKQARKFLIKTNTNFQADYLKTNKYFPSDEEERDIYTITLTKMHGFRWSPTNKAWQRQITQQAQVTAEYLTKLPEFKN